MSLRNAVLGCAVTGPFAAGLLTGITLAPGVAGTDGRSNELAVFPRRVESSASRLDTSYPAEVLRIIDGDTFEARVRVWPGIELSTKVRLRGIDAPEMSARCTEEASKAAAARDALAAMLAAGEVTISAVGLDKYGGRVVARTASRSTPDVSSALLDGGWARPYAGGRRETWCAQASR